MTAGSRSKTPFPFHALARFADNLYRARELSGLDQKEAAKRAALTRPKLDKIENAEPGNGAAIGVRGDPARSGAEGLDEGTDAVLVEGVDAAGTVHLGASAGAPGTVSAARGLGAKQRSRSSCP